MQRYTGRHNFVFFIVYGRARLTLGDLHCVPYRNLLLAPSFSADVPRVNYFSIRNASAKLPITFLFAKLTGPRGDKRHGMRMQRAVGGDYC